MELAQVFERNAELRDRRAHSELIIEIPSERLFDPIREKCLRSPTEIHLYLACINRIPPIMSGTIWNKGNEVFRFSHCLQQYFCNLQI